MQSYLELTGIWFSCFQWQLLSFKQWNGKPYSRSICFLRSHNPNIFWGTFTIGNDNVNITWGFSRNVLLLAHPPHWFLFHSPSTISSFHVLDVEKKEVLIMWQMSMLVKYRQKSSNDILQDRVQLLFKKKYTFCFGKILHFYIPAITIVTSSHEIMTNWLKSPRFAHRDISMLPINDTWRNIAGNRYRIDKS